MNDDERTLACVDAALRVCRVRDNLRLLSLARTNCAANDTTLQRLDSLAKPRAGGRTRSLSRTATDD